MTKAEKYLGESRGVDGVVTSWFFGRHNGVAHVLKLDGELPATLVIPEDGAGDFDIAGATRIDIADFWKLSGIEAIQDELRAYRDAL